ncbi:MAG: DoxX family protein [Burkholderiales bacterium]|nr:DoxX family protein [Burkholderiales bacterium]
MTQTSKTSQRLLLGARILLALAFGAAGASKLAGVEQMVVLFEHVGFGQWFRIFTGATEIVAVILVLLPATSFFGALLMAVTMVGAIATHLFLVGGSPAPAIVLGVLSAFVAYRLRLQVRQANIA